MSQGSHKQKETQLDFQAPAKKNNDHLISKLRALSYVEYHGTAGAETHVRNQFSPCPCEECSA